MSIYTQYTDSLRESRVTWDRAVEVFTDNAKTVIGQVQQSFATAVQVDPTENVFDYLKRTLDAQSDVSKKFAALTADFSEKVIAQSETLVSAARDYAGSAQEILRSQADSQYDQFAAARQRAEDALRQVPGAVEAKSPAKSK
jgi:N-acyl-D-aspartate/D-glutamate deacylase